MHNLLVPLTLSFMRGHFGIIGLLKAYSSNRKVQEGHNKNHSVPHKVSHVNGNDPIPV